MENVQSKAINRRNVLSSIGGATSAIASVVFPKTSSAKHVHDPIIELHHQWKQSRDELFKHVDDHPGIADKDIRQRCEAVCKHADKFRGLIATTIQGLECQMELAWDENGTIFIEHSDGYAQEMKDPNIMLLKSMLDGVRKLVVA